MKYDIKVAELPRKELSKICERIKSGTLKFRWRNGCKYVSSADLKDCKGRKPGRKKDVKLDLKGIKEIIFHEETMHIFIISKDFSSRNVKFNGTLNEFIEIADEVEEKADKYKFRYDYLVKGE